MFRRFQQERKTDPDDRPGCRRRRQDDRAAELAHEDRNVVGAARLVALGCVLVRQADAVVGDGKLDLVARALDAQHDLPSAAGKGVLDGVGCQFVDQEAERHGAVGVDVQGVGLDLDGDARVVPSRLAAMVLAISRR